MSLAALALGAVLVAPAPVAAAPGADAGLAADALAERRYDPRAERAAAPARDAVRALTAEVAGPRTGGFPRQTVLRTFPVDEADRSIKLGLVPYHEIARRLNALQRTSDRVSVEVTGRSALGRDLYLVTVTAPETPAQARRQEAMKQRILADPERAAQDRAIARDYKVPVFVNANIHGNEWEGTDASLRVIEELATSSDREVAALLRTTRVYFTVSANPDGRNAGTRRNARDFDLNRDFITASQPETRVMRDAIIRTQPVVLVDEHGYTGTTLIEPGTPPHGQNYEYDLYIKHALPNALGMEAAIQALGYPESARADIPFRDFPPGEWDDWPPIFTPMYSIYHGAVGHTVEFPLRVNNREYDALPVEELRRRSSINTDIAAATIRASIAYADEHRSELVADQIEVFRRGEAGEAQREVPDGYVDGFGPEDRYSTEFPRAYVIPAGRDQRSTPAAARLVQHLLDNDVEVHRASRASSLGGTRYAAGSWVVDMHQAKRGLANVMLESGRDISDDVPVMYDISGWSHGLLWGATVTPVEQGGDSLPGGLREVAGARSWGVVPAAPGRDLLIGLDDAADVAAVNALLARGHVLQLASGGRVVVPAAARADAVRVAREQGVRLSLAPAGLTGTPMDPVTVAAAAEGDELYAMREMGFEVRPVSNAVLDAGFDWTGVDVLVVGAGLDGATLGAPARAALDAFLADGGVVARGTTGAAFNAALDLLEVEAGGGPGTANGVVDVDGSGELTARAPGHSFVYSPVWFTGMGEGVVTEQSYAADPLVAGHWRPLEDGGGAPEDAAGAASVVRGLDETGASVVLFGTRPLFRDHPKGLYAQWANALYWTDATAG
ncbi:peptidase M28 [Vallicoccus soli]|uniref:Peptidase M28 n=1 Tax=Vallicoccus soli TaxID=2339232 RepID=A0A3A3Z719_9ACTN|nr:peptidase M28 [Vallicoccus soli]